MSGLRSFPKVLDVGRQSQARLKDRQETKNLNKSNSAEEEFKRGDTTRL
jgi:hypothetical protein